MSTSLDEVTALAHRIGRETAAIHAADVDVHARFPKETVDAFRAEGLLGALVPVELGGLGHFPTSSRTSLESSVSAVM